MFHGIAMNWYVVYTKPKCEDSAARLLGNAGIETLCPKIRVRKRTRGKYSEVTEQLFPSYIFAFFDRERQSHMIRYTRGVKYIVGKESPLIVHQEIIDTIKERMEGDIVVPVPEDISRGERVLIKEGPFKDFYGIFERDIPGRERSMILLEALHCAVDIEKRSIRKA
jgi:transcriptional antiterminator RfaH